MLTKYFPLADLNYVEDSAGGPDVTVGYLPKLEKVTLLQVYFLLIFFSLPGLIKISALSTVIFLAHIDNVIAMNLDIPKLKRELVY